MNNKRRKDQPVAIGLEVHIVQTGDVKKDKANVDLALRDFKKKVKKSGIMNELRQREAYMSPSAYKRYRKNEAIKRRKRDEKKQEWSNNQSE